MCPNSRHILGISCLIGTLFGQFIGEATMSQTTEFYYSPEGCPVFQSIWEVSATFQQFIAEYFEAHTAAFPTVQEEIIAMSEAMGMDPTEVFMQNACSELYLLFGDDVEVTATPQPVNDPPIYAPYLGAPTAGSVRHASTQTRSSNIRREHCSDIGLLYDHTDKYSNSTFASSRRVLQGHNEDWWSGVAASMSIVHASDWLGYLYPGAAIFTS